jgi:hypothetical protein
MSHGSHLNAHDKAVNTKATDLCTEVRQDRAWRCLFCLSASAPPCAALLSFSVMDINGQFCCIVGTPLQPNQQAFTTAHAAEMQAQCTLVIVVVPTPMKYQETGQ